MSLRCWESNQVLQIFHLACGRSFILADWLVSLEIHMSPSHPPRLEVQTCCDAWFITWVLWIKLRSVSLHSTHLWTVPCLQTPTLNLKKPCILVCFFSQHSFVTCQSCDKDSFNQLQPSRWDIFSMGFCFFFQTENSENLRYPAGAEL